MIEKLLLLVALGQINDSGRSMDLVSFQDLTYGGTVYSDIVFSGACASFQGSATNDGYVCCAEGCYGLTRGADEDPSDITHSGENAYSRATVNTTGGDVEISAGIGRRLITVTDYSVGSNDTVTLTVDGSATVLTEGSEFSCITSNNACASALAAAIDVAAVGLDATPVSAVVYVEKIDGDYVHTFSASVADGGVDGAFAAATEGNDGSVTIWHALSLNDQNITNVGDINVDSVTPDGSSWTGDDCASLTSAAANAASAGFLRAGNTECIGWRNAANSGDESLCVDASDDLTWSDSIVATGVVTGQSGLDAGDANITNIGDINVDTVTPDGSSWTGDDCASLTSAATNPAGTGVLRSGNTECLGWRNAANSGDESLCVNASDDLTWSDAFVATGLITGQGGLDAGDANITNVGDIDVDSITPDGASFTISGVASITSAAADPADTCVIRLGNDGTECIGWEASPASTDVTMTVNSSEQFVFTGDVVAGSGKNLVTANGVAILENSSVAGIEFIRTGAAYKSSFLAGAAGNPYLLANWQFIGGSTQNNATYPSWGIGFFPNPGDNMTIVRSPAGSSVLATMMSVNSTADVTANSFISDVANPADACVVRLGNAECVGWEASPASTDVTISVDASEIVQVSSDVAIPATKKQYFDGGSNTYCDESSADNLSCTAGGTKLFDGTTTLFDLNVPIQVPTYTLCVTPPSGYLTGPADAPSICINDLGDGAGDDTGAIGGLCFDDATTDMVYYNWEIPNCWDGASDMTIKVYWTTSKGNAIGAGEGVTWKVTYREMVDGTDSLNTRTAQTISANYTSGAGDADGKTFVTSLTVDYDAVGTVLNAGDTVYGTLFRDHDDADDDWGQDALMYRTEICFSSTTPSCNHL